MEQGTLELALAIQAQKKPHNNDNFNNNSDVRAVQFNSVLQPEPIR